VERTPAIKLIRIYFVVQSLMDRIGQTLSAEVMAAIQSAIAIKMRSLASIPLEDDFARAVLDLISEYLAEVPEAEKSVTPAVTADRPKGYSKAELPEIFDAQRETVLADAKLIAVDLFLNALANEADHLVPSNVERVMQATASGFGDQPARSKHPRLVLDMEIATRIVSSLETAKGLAGVAGKESDFAIAIQDARIASHSCRYLCGKQVSPPTKDDLREAVEDVLKRMRTDFPKENDFLEQAVNFTLLLAWEVRDCLRAAPAEATTATSSPTTT